MRLQEIDHQPSFLSLLHHRPYWRCYFPNTQAIIYVVDSSDTDRLVIAKEEFHAILEEEELRGAVVLIFANKQVAKAGGYGHRTRSTYCKRK
ncbi:hypothetical protein Goarm_011038 [Gossypium armourianum]|uniref:ADP-ribosylation factor 1 n=1 Tax=Gossypium armourianum TaxID=34283 RepID=A0A7J9IX51_9ROSI|nr:hypothetical protein [Gossypium armourianum]